MRWKGSRVRFDVRVKVGVRGKAGQGGFRLTGQRYEPLRRIAHHLQG